MLEAPAHQYHPIRLYGIYHIASSVVAATCAALFAHNHLVCYSITYIITQPNPFVNPYRPQNEKKLERTIVLVLWLRGIPSHTTYGMVALIVSDNPARTLPTTIIGDHHIRVDGTVTTIINI